jgi:hypothetical protein
MDDPQAWGDGYDVAAVQGGWRSLRIGEPSKGAERLLQRVVWRAMFTDYLAEVNGEEPPTRSADRIALTRARGVRARRFTGRALRKVARVVEPV